MTINNSTNSRFFAFPAVNIDGTITGDTILFTAPANFVATGYATNLSAATGATTGITFSIGTNAPDYNNLIFGQSLPSISTGETYSDTFTDGILVTTLENVRFNVDTAEPTASVYTLQVSVYGVFI